MAVEFILATHAGPIQVVEIWVNGEMVGTVYPSEAGDGVRLLSRHVAGAHTTEHANNVVNFHVAFKFRPELEPEEPEGRG